MKVKVVCLMFVRRHAMLVYGQINEAGSEAGGQSPGLSIIHERAALDLPHVGNVSELKHELWINMKVGPLISTQRWFCLFVCFFKEVFPVFILPKMSVLWSVSCIWNRWWQCENDSLFFFWWKVYILGYDLRLFLVVCRLWFYFTLLYLPSIFWQVSYYKKTRFFFPQKDILFFFHL